MGYRNIENDVEEKSKYFPRSDGCDDPKQTNPVENTRKIKQEVEWVPIIEIPKCVKTPPYVNPVPPPTESPPAPKPIKPITGEPSIAPAIGGSQGSGSAGSGTGGASSGPPPGIFPRQQQPVSSNQNSGGAGGRTPNGKPGRNGIKPRDKGPSGNGGGGGGGNQGKNPPTPAPKGKAAPYDPCDCTGTPPWLRRDLESIDRKIARHEAAAAKAQSHKGGASRASSERSWAEFWRNQRKKVEARVNAWREKCLERCSDPVPNKKKKGDKNRPVVPQKAIAAAQLPTDGIVNNGNTNIHDYAGSTAALPNQAALAGDWKGEYNPTDGEQDIILPAAVEIPNDQEPYGGASTTDPNSDGVGGGGERSSATPADTAGGNDGNKPPNVPSVDTPCRYIIPTPNYGGKEGQPVTLSLNPHNSPSDINEGGFPFSNNSTPSINVASGPLSQQFFTDLVNNWSENFDLTSDYGDAIAAVANQFSQLVLNNGGNELTTSDMAGALLAGLLDGEATNEQYATAIQIVNAILLEKPRYLMVSSNPSRDFRYGIDNGNFTPSANRSAAINGIPIAAPTPSGFNVGFNPDKLDDQVIDGNLFRRTFNSGVIGSGGGASINGNKGGVLIEEIPERNNILVNASGQRLLPDGRLNRNNLPPLVNSNANIDVAPSLQDEINAIEEQVIELTEKQREADSRNDQATVTGLQDQINVLNNSVVTLKEQLNNFTYNAETTLETEILAEQSNYTVMQSIWQSQYEILLTDPNNTDYQSAEISARANVRESERRLHDLQNKLQFAAMHQEVGDVPDPNPSGVALPQPFMALDVDGVIPAFSYELLQYEMSVVQTQIVEMFAAASNFVTSLQAELFNTVNRQNSVQISYDRQIEIARVLRRGATNEFNKQLARLATKLGGGINVEGTFGDLTNPVLQDGNGNARPAANPDTQSGQYAADIAAITAALSLAYISAGLNNIQLTGTTTVPPTSGDELNDQQIANELGLATPSSIHSLPTDLASKFIDMSNNAQQFRYETLVIGDVNDPEIANKIEREGLKYEPLANMVKAWLAVQPIQFPKRLSVWMFGGTLETKTFENTWISTTYRGVLNRGAIPEIDRNLNLQVMAANTAALRTVTQGLSDSLQQAQVTARIEAIRPENDPIRIGADLAVTQLTEQLETALDDLSNAQAQLDAIRRMDNMPAPLPAGQFIQNVIQAETGADEITLALGSIDSITTQWANGQNTGYEEDKTDYIFKVFENIIEPNPLPSQTLHIKSLLDRFLNVLIGRYKLTRDSIQNSDDVNSLPVVVDTLPGLITDQTPVGAAYNVLRPLKVVYDLDPPVIVQDGSVIGGGLQPRSNLPMTSLNPEAAYFNIPNIQEEFVAEQSWDVVEKYMIPELLAPGCTYSNILPSPNAPEICCIVTNAPFSFDLIITVPDYVAGEIRAQILDGFHTMIRHYVGYFNGSINSQGLKNDETINTQIAVKFKYGNIDTFRLPRPLQAYNKLLGNNQAAVNITIPTWNEMFAQGFNWGTYGSQFFDIAYKALRDAIKWARSYASAVETHLNQSVRAKIDATLPTTPTDAKLDNPAKLSEPYDFRIITTVTETPQQNHVIDPADLYFYSMDVDIDFADAFADLDIAGFGKIDSGAAGKFRNFFLHHLMPLRSSDHVNSLLFGGQQVFRNGCPMRLAFHTLSSFFFAKRPFRDGNYPRWKFTFHFGWDAEAAPYANPSVTDDTLSSFYNAPDRPRTNTINSAGNRSNNRFADQPTQVTGNIVSNGKLGFVNPISPYPPYLFEGAPWDLPDIPLPELPSVERKNDVMMDTDFIGRRLEEYIQGIVYAFLNSLKNRAIESFKGTTVLWPVNYGLLNHDDLLSLLDKEGNSNFPDKIDTLALDSHTLLVYPINQTMYEESLQQSTVNTGRGPLTTEFQANNLGVVVTPSQHGDAPNNGIWIPAGTNFARNTSFENFISQLDQIINIQHALNSMSSRGDWAGQHVLAKVVEKSGTKVKVVPINFDGRAAANTRLNGRLKIEAQILAPETDIRVGDEVWLSHDLSKNRIPFVWPSPRSGMQIEMSQVDIPVFKKTDLGNIPFLGQNVNGQFDGTGLTGNIYKNLLPSIVNTVNKLVGKSKFNNIETGSMDVIAGIGFITLDNEYVSNPQVIIETASIQSDPPGIEALVKPLVYARVSDTIEVRFYDVTTGLLATTYNDSLKYTIVGPTVATNQIDGAIAQTGLFRDSGARY